MTNPSGVASFLIPAPGTYVLVVGVRRSTIVRTARLGYWEAVPGCYLYIGSALGPGGVRARVSRHLRSNVRCHWHVDHLTHFGTIEEVWYCLDAVHREHNWAAMVARLRGAVIPCPRFGASDCRCVSHLYLFSKKPSVQSFRRLLKVTYAGHPTVRRLCAA